MKKTHAIKRLLSLALVVVLLALGGVPAFAASKPGGSYVVTASRLNVHGSANWYDVVGKLKKGTVVTYMSSKNGWWYVKFSGGKGYVDKRYLTSVTSTSTKYAATCNLRVRSSASMSGVVIGKLKKGLKVTLVKQKGSWAYIDYKGRRGWVAAKYLKKA